MAVKNGFTLVEVLVVVSLFAVIALITAQSLIKILGNTSNSNSTARARENIEHVMSITERSIRNARSISCDPNLPNRVTYVTQENATETFRCSTLGANNTYIEQNGTSLVSEEVSLTQCLLKCLPEGSLNPNGVEIVLEATDQEAAYDAAPVKLQTTIFLRSY